MASVFSRIISGEIPSFKVFEDELTYAFLDIHPLTEGHTLVVPKIEIDEFIDVPEPYYSAVFSTSKRVSAVLKQTFQPQRVCMIVEGFLIPHFHVHLIPCDSPHDLKKEPETTKQEDLQRIQIKIKDKFA